MRRRPYTARGIVRIPCFRCGAPSTHQWNICADGNQFRGLCATCDVGLNRTVLRWLRDPDWRAKVAAYVKDVTSLLPAGDGQPAHAGSEHSRIDGDGRGAGRRRSSQRGRPLGASRRETNPPGCRPQSEAIKQPVQR